MRGPTEICGPINITITINNEHLSYLRANCNNQFTGGGILSRARISMGKGGGRFPKYAEILPHYLRQQNLQLCRSCTMQLLYWSVLLYLSVGDITHITQWGWEFWIFFRTKLQTSGPNLSDSFLFELLWVPTYVKYLNDSVKKLAVTLVEW